MKASSVVDPVDAGSPGNPMGWPEEIRPVLENFTTCDFATLTRGGTPVTYPLTPYVPEDRRTVDVSTGLSYPAKAERVRRNPRVGLLFSDPSGSGLDFPPTVLVYGFGAVRDAALQANTDRYVRVARTRFPEAYRAPRFVLRLQHWYFVRIWVPVTPVRVLWWPDGNLEAPPREWVARPDIELPESDPSPAGKQGAPWAKSPHAWQGGALQALRAMGPPTLTTVDDNGFPVPFKVKSAALHREGFILQLYAGAPVRAPGSACLTFQRHPESLTGQENRVFVGQLDLDASVPDHALFKVGRRLADFSLGLSRFSTAVTFLRSSIRLTPALRRELARRRQPLPTIKL